MSNIALVIPARLGSTRLQRKALADIHGAPMVVRVAECAARAKGIGEIIVATDSEEIARVVRAAGFTAAMTDENLKSGTDRVAAVAATLKYPIIVTLQGDEPVMPAATIEAAIAPIVERGVLMASAFTKFANRAEYMEPSCVKVLTDHEQNAIYFSRHTIPYTQNPISDEELLNSKYLGKHLGLYAYQRDFLLRYAKMDPVLSERAESLEQLRALHNGIKIGMGFAAKGSQSVDTASDLDKARDIFYKEFR